MNRFVLVVIFFGGLLLSYGSFGQAAGDFRSFQTGNWSTTSTWERYDGAIWVNPAPNTPTSADGVITIQGGHTITDATGVTADQITINSGGVLVISGVTFTVAAGSGDDLTINSGGTVTIGSGATLQIQNSVVPPPPKVALVRVHGTINNTGTISNASTSTLIFEAGSTYDHQHTTTPGTIPTASWNVTSTCKVTGYTTNSSAPSGLGQNFGNFTWDTGSLSAYIDLNGGLTTVNGDLIIQNVPSSYIYLTATNNYTLNVGGDLTISSSYMGLNSTATVTVNVTGNALFSSNNDFNPTFNGNTTIDVNGNFEISGGTTNLTYGGSANMSINVAGNFTLSSSPSINNGGSGTYTLTFDGSGSQSYAASQAFTDFDYIINNGSSVNVANANFFSGSGAFTLQAGGTLGVGSTNGLVTGTASGNVRVIGIRTYTANADIVYNGAAAQNLGNEWGGSGALNAVAVNLEIDNSNGSGVTNNLVSAANIVGDLTLSSGSFNIGGSNSMDIKSNFIVTSGTIGGSLTSDLTFSGSGSMGTLTMTSGSESLNNLTISRAGDLVLGSALTISGTLALTGNLDFSGNTLTINGASIDDTGGGGLKSSSTSNLVIGGSGFSGAIPFSGTGNQLNDLTFNSTGGATYTWNSAVTINNNVNMNQGTLTHSSGLTMAANSTFVKGAGSITTNSPIAVTNYNVVYNSAGTTSFELPSSSTALNDLTVSVSGTVTLQSSTTVNGTLSIPGGTLDASTNNLTMNGTSWVVNGGTFTIDASNAVTFGSGATTTLSGSSIGGTQFGNVTINSGTTISAPNANLNVSGTWDNQGIFTANGGTITFNGANQNIDPSAQPFNNVDFAGSGTKTLQGPLDVNGSLTVNSSLDVGANNSINVAGTWNNSGTFTPAGGTVTFDGTTQTITSAGQAFYNLTLSNGGTKTLGDAIDINGNLTIDNGVTLDVSVSDYAINLAGNWANNGTFNERTGTITFDGTTVISGSSTTDFYGITIAGNLTATAGTINVAGNWLHSSGTFTNNSGTINFNGGGNQSITSGLQTFNNIIISGLNTKTLQDNMDINGNLTLNSGILDVGLDRQINLAGNFDASGGGGFTAAAGKVVFDGITQSINGGAETFNNIDLASGTTATITGDLNITGDWNAIAGSSFSTSAGTVSFSGAAQNITSTGGSFGAVVIAGSGTKTLQDAFIASGDLTITSTLDVGTNFNVNVGGSWDSGSGTFIPASGMVTLDGAAQSITSGANSFNDITLAGTGSKTLQDAFDVNGNLTISSGLDVGADQPITLVGDWTNNGTFTSAAGKVTFDGNGTSNVLGSATTAFNDLDVTGSTNVEIETTHNLAGTLSLVGASSAFDADGSGGAGVFTLVSSSDNPATDGNIAALSTPANFIGDVTVQRYLASEGGIWRYLTTPVSGLTVADWQVEFPITGSFTGADDLGGANQSSLYIYDETNTGTADLGWTAYPSAANTESISPGVGYSTFIRISGGQTTVNQRGPINKGNFTFSVSFTTGQGASDDGWNLLGNPYPAALDWNLLYNDAFTANINPTMYIKDNGGGGGVYATFNASSGTGTNGGTKNIALGQSFWVQANSGGTPALRATESMKTTDTHEFFKLAPPVNFLRVALSDGIDRDETLIHFFDDALPGKDRYDAYKIKNDIFNLSTIMNDSSEMVINAIGSLNCDSEVSLSVTDISEGNYFLDFTDLDSFNEILTIYLTDNFTNSYNLVTNNYIYQFSVTADSSSFGPSRFKLSFVKPAINTELLIGGSNVCEFEEPIVSINDSELGVNYYLTLNGVGVSDTLAGNGEELQIAILDTLSTGSYEYTVKADNGCGVLSMTNTAVVDIEKTYEVTQVIGDQNCGSGSLLLKAAGAPDTGTYRWFENLLDELPLSETNLGEFNTPSIDSSHVYYVAIVNSLGCEGDRQSVEAKVINLELPTIELDTIDIYVYRLISSYELGNQWYLNGTAIDGATSNTLLVSDPGIYSLEVENNGCTIFSDDYNYDDLVTGITGEDIYNNAISISPNPFVSSIEVNISQDVFNLRKTEITVFDINGKIVFFDKRVKNENILINLDDFNNGIYLINIYDGETAVQRKIVKE